MESKIRIGAGVYFALAFGFLTLPAGWVLNALAAALIHELGHLAAVWMCEGKVRRIELRVGGAVMETSPLEPEEELICALAGPAAGAVLCLFRRWFPGLAGVALVQTVFNLLPLYPLDGGRAWRAARNICCKPGEKRVQ